MGEWSHELLIGTASAILGAAILYLAAFEVRITKSQRESALRFREEEIAMWGKSNPLQRQKIINFHIFDILRWFILRNV